MDLPSECPQTWPVLDDQEVRHAKNANPQKRNDVTPTDTPNKDTQTNVNTEETTEPQQVGSKEQDAKDWSQLIQEDEDGGSTMMVDDDSTEQSIQRKTAPTRGAGKSPGEGEPQDNPATATSRPKKLKLGTGSEQRTDRHRSRTRKVINKKENYEHTT
jgi:hypothetical protein